MDAYIETGFQVPNSLMAEFTKQYPNVKWNIRQDQFAVITQNAPRVLASDPPDIMRLPSISDLVKDGLLKNLDGYATAYGWDKWPSSELVQLKLGPGGRPRGEGSLYAMGLNYSMTGVFYNEKLAAKIGMTSAPATLAELDQDLAKAKRAGITPIVQFNGGATGGFAFPLQDLMASYGPPGPVNDWIFNKPGATIDTPANLQAAQHLAQWIKAGYFESDANAMDYATMISHFTHNNGLFMFDGDWESGNFDKLMPGQVGILPDASRAGRRPARGDVRPADLRHRRQGQACRLRRLLLQLGGDQLSGPDDRRAGRRIPPAGCRQCADARDQARHGHRADARGRLGHQQGERLDGLHRERDGRHLRLRLDA